MHFVSLRPGRIAAALATAIALFTAVAVLNSCAADASGPDLDRICFAPVLRVLPREATVQAGDSVEFSAWTYIVGDSGLVDVTWTSSAPKLRVTGKGKESYKGKRVGNFRITASPDSLADSVTVTRGPVGSVHANPPAVALHVGQDVTLTADVRDTAGVLLTDWPVDWSSGSPSVASIDNSGRVQAKAAGTAEVTVASERVVGTAALTTAYKNGVTMAQVAESMDADGAPRMGFNLGNFPAGCSGTKGNY